VCDSKVNTGLEAEFPINGPVSSMLIDSSVPFVDGEVESKFSGRKVSLHNLLRTFCFCPKWRFILSATTKFQDFSRPKPKQKIILKAQQIKKKVAVTYFRLPLHPSDKG
jgi:hypothetical protein